jgi:hypothetical protein
MPCVGVRGCGLAAGLATIGAMVAAGGLATRPTTWAWVGACCCVCGGGSIGARLAAAGLAVAGAEAGAGAGAADAGVDIVKLLKKGGKWKTATNNMLYCTAVMK